MISHHEHTCLKERVAHIGGGQERVRTRQGCGQTRRERSKTISAVKSAGVSHRLTPDPPEGSGVDYKQILFGARWWGRVFVQKTHAVPEAGQLGLSARGRRAVGMELPFGPCGLREE